MNWIISTIFEKSLNLIIIGLLFIICVVLASLAFILYPIKKARVFIGKQLYRIGYTMEYFLYDTPYKIPQDDIKED